METHQSSVSLFKSRRQKKMEPVISSPDLSNFGASPSHALASMSSRPCEDVDGKHLMFFAKASICSTTSSKSLMIDNCSRMLKTSPLIQKCVLIFAFSYEVGDCARHHRLVNLGMFLKTMLHLNQHARKGFRLKPFRSLTPQLSNLIASSWPLKVRAGIETCTPTKK